MIKIEKMHIEGIGPIKNLTLEFNPNFNIICGQNGIGKTTILECVCFPFLLNCQHSLKRNAEVEEGSVTIDFRTEKEEKQITEKLRNFKPQENISNISSAYKNALDILYFKTRRDIPYFEQKSIEVDSKRNEANCSNELATGVNSLEIKKWLVNRYLWSPHKDKLSEEEKSNLELAKTLFSTIDSNVKFDTVDHSTNDIRIDTPTGNIVFEYLSSGYKSCLAVLLGLIKEIEYRHPDKKIKVEDFEGIVLIDELDLHLHPEWQAKVYLGLKRMLPKAQIITTTHSPHIIQVAQANEIIPLVSNNGNIYVNNILNAEYGCQGWTVEEILTEVMHMKETRSGVFMDAMNGFQKALEQEDKASAMKCYEQLDEMLHPDNVMRKLLKIQLSSLG